MKCDKCDKRAVWTYMPGDSNLCDDCVPRGCSCTEEPVDDTKPFEEWEWVKGKDKEGRFLSCCEWWEIENNN